MEQMRKNEMLLSKRVKLSVYRESQHLHYSGHTHSKRTVYFVHIQLKADIFTFTFFILSIGKVSSVI